MKMNAADKESTYQQVLTRIESLISQERDEIALMATVVCELHHSLPYFDWTGFYRVTEPQLLSIGPYQGTHGCLRIPFAQGICGRAARSEQTIIIVDVHAETDHIACSSSTLSEIVVPLFNADQQLIAVLDVDSNEMAAFDEVDKKYLERVCELIRKNML